MDKHQSMNQIIDSMKYDLYLLAINHDINTKTFLLGQLSWKLQTLEQLNNNLKKVKLPKRTVEENERLFTVEELSNFNGKNGVPAYIAVNNTVYDVTNNAAWAAATHFGLSAGRNLTNEFATCHNGQLEILQQLVIVGRLIN